MAVEVTVPEEHVGVIIATSTPAWTHRAHGSRGGSQVIKAIVPLKEMFGYVNDIRSSTQGRASYSMQFARYEEAPRMIATNHRPVAREVIGLCSEDCDD